jgi:uncharacterized protein with von Willebrand factor type A (vWA) domain
VPRTIPLQGLYFHLVRSGFSLSVRDYHDAIMALRRGYGSPTREDLRWVCETLWARTDHEVARIQRLFRELPWPTDADVRELTDVPPQAVAPGRTGAEGSRGARSTSHVPAAGAPVVEFVGPSESGVGLPSVTTPSQAADVFIFTPRPLLNLRSLIIAWRRFRIAQRSGPRVEFDVDATVAEHTRRGFLLEPVFLPSRRNLARLLVLIDSSESMAAWRHMHPLIAESLRRSQLAHTALYHFDNVPQDEFYEQETLSRAVDVEAALKQHPACALLIVGDAGAARGRLDRERVRQTRTFVNAVKHVWHPVAWLNPMPPARWRDTTAAATARLPGLTMFPFTDDGLIQAVDYLRGKRD